jgi:hypothetical protein
MQIIAAQKGSIWIADMSDSEGVFSKQIQEALASTVMQEQAAAAGIKHILTVLPKVAGLSSLNTKSWLRKVQNMERQDNIVEFPTLETCIGWIKSR